MQTETRFGGIEAGGTKFVCAVGVGTHGVQTIEEIPTRKPEQTIPDLIDFFRLQASQSGALAGIGVGSFGPVELQKGASNYGHITTTPKSDWQDVDIRGELARGLDLPVAIDTDVNAAATGELNWGAAQGLKHCLYVTVGTGVGVGAIVDGQILFGYQHPEMGHMRVAPALVEPGGFEGICPYHRSCVEGMASGRAIVHRWGKKLCDLPEDHPAWDLEAHYLAAFLSNLTFVLQPERIVIGGGVMDEALLGIVREQLRIELGGYRNSLATLAAVEDYLVLPALDGRAGVLGAIAMAKQRVDEEQ